MAAIPYDEAAVACAAYRALYPRLYKVAMAIKAREGWAPGTRSFRNNNPGNLRSSPCAVGSDAAGNSGSYCTFADYHTGLFALIRDLFQKCSGHSSHITPDESLEKLIHVWAPAEDANDPTSYANFVARVTGELKSVPIRELLG